MKYEILRFNALTNYNVILFLVNINYKNLYNLYAINTCLSWIILVTFNSSVLLDKNAFKKIREKNNYNYYEFHIGNFVLHTIPCIYIYKNPPLILDYYHCAVSIILKLLWCFISTKGTMDLSEIYVKFDSKVNLKLYLISITTGLCVPIFYNKYIL